MTQNVDDLHERGGSTEVIHMHGELRTLRCEASGRNEVRMQTQDLADDFLFCTCCELPSRLRPDIVWFGEMPLQMNKINQALESCDVFVAIGTSGNVYPASGFYQTAKIRRAHTVELNLERTSSGFDEHILGNASEIVPTYLESLLQAC